MPIWLTDHEHAVVMPHRYVGSVHRGPTHEPPREQHAIGDPHSAAPEEIDEFPHS